jgi:glycosyltransferase involved in cell wall biosynthesis
MGRPDVSVIVPVFNAPKTLPDAIASVRAQQVPVRVIVVDDGSTDDTPALLASIRDIVAVRQTHQGPAAARNRGLDCARTPLVAFVDADDLWEPGKLRAQRALLDANPAAGIVLGHTAFSVLDPSRGEWTRLAAPHLMYSLGASLIRREVFETQGRFDEALRASEDVDWFLRARDAGVRMIVTADVVQVHRRNGENMTRGKDLRDLQFIEVLKRSLDRRRAVSNPDGIPRA